MSSIVKATMAVVPLSMTLFLQTHIATAAPTAAEETATAGAEGHGYKGQDLEKSAKVAMTAARDIALKARPGKVTDTELEKESGGSGLRYSFDIKVGAKTYEVGVDANTGKVLENKQETAANAD